MKAHVVEILRQHGGGVRIVRDVEDYRGLARQDLEAARQRGLQQPQSHGLLLHGQAIAHGFQRGQRRRGVEQLIGAAQSRVGHRTAALFATAVGPLLTVAGIVVIASEQPQVCTDGFDVIQQRLRGDGIAADGRPAAAIDMGFFEADFFTRVAQPVGVVQVDAGDDGDVGIDDVDGIQASAQADFEHDRVQPRLREEAQNGQRGEFKIRQRHIAARGFDGLELRDEVLVGGDLAVDAGTLVEVDEVRRGVQAHLVASRKQDGLEHGTGGTFAVGAADHEFDAGQRQLHAVRDLAHPVQPHVDRGGVDGLQVLQPIGQVGGGVRRADRRHEAGSRKEISLRF